MNKLNENYPSINQMAGRLLNSQKADIAHATGPELSFQEILNNKQSEKTEGLKFSKHANQRLENGTTKAREKGIRESLVMVDDMAFIVNVSNNTVITAVGSSADSIFTNIDGAVIG